jgi:hypothetical protein
VALPAGQVFFQQGVDFKRPLTTVAAEDGGYSIDFQLCSFNDSAAAQVIEIPLDPLGLQIAQSADLEIDRYYLFYVAHFRMCQDDLKNAFRYRKLVHLPSPLELLLCCADRSFGYSGIQMSVALVS